MHLFFRSHLMYVHLFNPVFAPISCLNIEIMLIKLQKARGKNVMKPDKKCPGSFHPKIKRKIRNNILLKENYDYS